MTFTVAIIGRPNVGKSTLYNRLTGTQHALVDDRPGVTRDRRQGDANLFSLEFKVIDTPGLEEAEEGALERRMMLQTECAIEEAQVCLVVIDGREGVTPIDEYFARWVRKMGKPTMLLVNKSEGKYSDSGFADALRLGFEETIPTSAAHNMGMEELYHALKPHEKAYRKLAEAEEEERQEIEDKYIQIAIIGRPNTGKSTLLNRLYGSERVLTGPEAGVTRDAIAIDWEFEGKRLRLIDTAGVRRKSNIKAKLERMSVSDTFRALRFAHVAVVLIDATMPLEKQDIAIADMAIKEGRAVVLGVNKWDLVENPKEVMEEIRHQAERVLPQVLGVDILPISAKDGLNVRELIKCSLNAYTLWNKRVPTAKLNMWVKEAEQKHLPPLASNKRRIRLKYATQGNTRPPTFTIFANKPEDLPQSYRRYLVNSLRDTFKMPGAPIRMMFRKSDNPYEKKK
jgi:GTP-binding protein